MLVAVGSENPVKVDAVKRAFAVVWPEEVWEVRGSAVSSAVRAQPLSDKECIRGATNRAKRALKKQADFGVGLEGGLQRIGTDWFDAGWAVVIAANGTTGIASSLRMQTPPPMLALVNEGKELGEIDDLFFHTHNSKQASGHFGLMTQGHITRTTAYTDAVIAALVRFLHPELF